MHVTATPSPLVAPPRGLPPGLCFRGHQSVTLRTWTRPRRTPLHRSAAITAVQESAAPSLVVPSNEELGLDKTESELYAEFDALLDANTLSFKSGEKVKGHIIQVDQKGAHVDVGGKSAAFVPNVEMALGLVPRSNDLLDAGTSREFVIVRQDHRGDIILSLKRIQLSVAWQRLRQIAESDAAVTGVVAATNRGGLLVDVEGVRGFNPSSQIGIRTTNWEELIGRHLQFKILEVDEETGRLMLSHRRVMNEERLETFKAGDVVEGRVMSVKPYGAFIDLGGGSSGLLHISQISSARITAVDRVLSPDDRIKVLVLSQDRDKGRISLCTKKLEPAPGDMLKDPGLVYERAEEMAAQYRAQIAAAEAAARASAEQLDLEVLAAGAGEASPSGLY
ncbi:PRPS1 [Auxenochlorella protothecoides x Auxenochlorella symbiontica]